MSNNHLLYSTVVGVLYPAALIKELAFASAIVLGTPPLHKLASDVLPYSTEVKQ
jgi:hypothetical protein